MPVYLDAKNLNGGQNNSQQNSSNQNNSTTNNSRQNSSQNNGAENEGLNLAASEQSAEGHSPAMNINLVIPKKKYSLYRDDSLIGLPTPTFDAKEVKAQKTGPSSRTTVLAMSGLFVVGIMLMLSGFIVLIQHREYEFVITGCVFMGVGLLMLIICVILQRKNVVKLMHQLDQDLYFLNITGNPMWKLMFEGTEAEHGIKGYSSHTNGRPNSGHYE
uniref:Uncharacterized protein n=1 Tax=Plectus sambesii TaxID=2011161 RepID=A0A914X760_9BILA